MLKMRLPPGSGARRCHSLEIEIAIVGSGPEVVEGFASRSAERVMDRAPDAPPRGSGSCDGRGNKSPGGVYPNPLAKCTPADPRGQQRSAAPCKRTRK